MNKIIGIVQARMGSIRLPGKVMLDIAGKPMLAHIVNRLGKSSRLDQVVISTADTAENNVIRTFAEANEIPYFAGSESDLIDRILNTTRYFEANTIVRITADCPFVDPGVVDNLIQEYLRHSDQIDYVSNNRPPTYPHGLDAEIYPRATLEKLWNEITDPLYREWFPVYLWEHEEQFRTLNVASPQDLSHLRWTVDYPEDLEFTRAVFQRLIPPGAFTMDEVLALLEREPQLIEINGNHHRQEGFLTPTDNSQNNQEHTLS